MSERCGGTDVTERMALEKMAEVRPAAATAPGRPLPSSLRGDLDAAADIQHTLRLYPQLGAGHPGHEASARITQQRKQPSRGSKPAFPVLSAIREHSRAASQETDLL